MSDTKQDMDKLNTLIKDIRIAMLTTIDEDGSLRARPMATQDEPFDGDLWFFTDAKSHKVLEIEKEQRVNVAYSSPAGNSYVSISGNAQLVTDKTKINALWKPVLKAWFPDGPETSGIALLKIPVDSAEYWDAPHSAVVKLVGLAKSVVTGERADIGENEKLNFN